MRKQCGFVGNAQRRTIQSSQSGERRIARQAQRHAEIAEVRERVAQRRQFPVDDGDHARLFWMEHQVVDAEVAVRQRNHAIVGRASAR